MFIILIAHIPNNAATLYIPARFGFSDATEMFVFCSGMASAIAFGRLFDRSGFLVGTGRVLLRVWQVYWAHVAVFITVAAIMAVAGTAPAGWTYLSSLNLQVFFDRPAELLPAFLTLRYVPNYFDILPMYLVILAMLPAMLAAERVHRIAPFVLMAVIWGLAQARLLDLSAEPWSDRPWYFNPFGWQLAFFTGFFLMRGTLPAPAIGRGLLALAVVMTVATIPFAWHVTKNAVPALAAAADSLRPLTDKSHFGILRLVHFLALAVIAVHLVGPGGARLRGRAVEVISVVGQQSLAVFIAGMVSARVLGMAFDHAGTGGGITLVVNLFGFALLIAVAYAVRWFKAAPWKEKPAR